MSVIEELQESNRRVEYKRMPGTYVQLELTEVRRSGALVLLSLALYLHVSLNFNAPVHCHLHLPTLIHGSSPSNRFFLANRGQLSATVSQRQAFDQFLSANQRHHQVQAPVPAAFLAERRTSSSQQANSDQGKEAKKSPNGRQARTLVCYYTSKGSPSAMPKDVGELVFPADAAADGFTPVFHHDTIELGHNHLANNKQSNGRRSQQMTFRPALDLLPASDSSLNKLVRGAKLKYLEPFSHLLSDAGAPANSVGGRTRSKASVPLESEINNAAGKPTSIAKQTAPLAQVYSPFVPAAHYSLINEFDSNNNRPIVGPAHPKVQNQPARNNGNNQLMSSNGPSIAQTSTTVSATKPDVSGLKRNRPPERNATARLPQQVPAFDRNNLALAGHQLLLSNLNQANNVNKDSLPLDTGLSQLTLASFSRALQVPKVNTRASTILPYQQRIDTPSNPVRVPAEQLKQHQVPYQSAMQQLVISSNQAGSSHTHSVRTPTVGGNNLSVSSKLSPYLAQQAQQVSFIGLPNEPNELLEEASASIEAQLNAKKPPSSPRPSSPSQSVATSSSLLSSSTSLITTNGELGEPLSPVSSSTSSSPSSPSPATLSSPLPHSSQPSATSTPPSSLAQSTPLIASQAQISAAGNDASSASQPVSPQTNSLVSSPLSTMLDAFGMASQYFMRFKPSSLISPSAFALNSINSNVHHQIGPHNMHRLYPSAGLPVTSLKIPSLAPLDTNNSSSSLQAASSSISSPNPIIPLSFPASLLAGVQKLTPSADKTSISGSSGAAAAANDRSSAGSGGFLARFTSAATAALSSGGATSREQQRREDVCGRTIQTPQRRIIGGEGARYGEFPYQVHIKIAKHQCGGALVDRQSIVTAAHCVYHFITRAPVSKLQIVIGAYDIEDEQYQELPPQYFKVNKVKLHPNFRFSASHPDRYDIAILKLDKPVKYTDNVLPVCLPGKDLKFESMVGTVTGFGKTDPSLSNRYGTRLLQKVDVPIIENNECERWHRTRGIDLKIFPEMMCAGYEDGLKDACVGDSGGPLVVKTASGPDGSFRWTLAGITSAGFGCAQSRQPGIYHRVSHTVDWILENLD